MNLLNRGLTILLLLCFSLLTGCGFHIRTQGSLPPQLQTMYLKASNPRTTLITQLTANLQELGVHLVDTPTQAPITLNIINENFTQASSTLGTAQQLNTVTLTYTVYFSITNQQGKTLVGPTMISSNTSYLQNANQILGASTAVPALQQGLVRDVIQQILNHLSALNTRKALAAA